MKEKRPTKGTDTDTDTHTKMHTYKFDKDACVARSGVYALGVEPEEVGKARGSGRDPRLVEDATHDGERGGGTVLREGGGRPPCCTLGMAGFWTLK